MLAMRRALSPRCILREWRRLDKTHAKLIAVPPDDFASAVDSAAGGDRQKEFLVGDGNRWVGDRQPRAGLRNIRHQTCDAPRAVDADDVGFEAAFEADPRAFSVAVCHLGIQSSKIGSTMCPGRSG